MASCQDFKTASQENVFEVSATIATAEFAKSQVKEWMKPVEAPHAKSVLISPPVAIDHLFPPYTKEKVQALNQWFEY